MAVVESIPEKVQTPSAQKGVLDYCMQPSKPLMRANSLRIFPATTAFPRWQTNRFSPHKRCSVMRRAAFVFIISCSLLCPEKIFLRRRSTKSEWSLSKVSATVKQSSPRISTANICTITLSYALMTLMTVGNCITINFSLPICVGQAMKSVRRTG